MRSATRWTEEALSNCLFWPAVAFFLNLQAPCWVLSDVSFSLSVSAIIGYMPLDDGYQRIQPLIRMLLEIKEFLESPSELFDFVLLRLHDLGDAQHRGNECRILLAEHLAVSILSLFHLPECALQLLHVHNKLRLLIDDKFDLPRDIVVQNASPKFLRTLAASCNWHGFF